MQRQQIVLSLVALVGMARNIVSERVQNELFQLGYYWGSRSDGIPRNLDSGALYINSPEWDAQRITWDAHPQMAVSPSVVYDAATQLNEFLVAAKLALVTKRYVIEGVQVTITPDEVKMDTTALLQRVAARARELQEEEFETEDAQC